MSDALPTPHAEAAARPAPPPDLEAALVELLAEALVAELMEAEKSPETQGTRPTTGVSPSGLNHPVADDRNA